MALRVTATTCLGCNIVAAEKLLAFGAQPPSNRFLPVGQAVQDLHDLSLGQCPACGLLQLVDPMPVDMVRSRHPWLAYNEPEGHLDGLVEQLAQRVSTGAKIFGLTYKDDSTLARFNRLGYYKTFRYQLDLDFGIEDPCAGLETLQAAFDEQLAARLVEKYGKADLLIVRHVLEHAHNPSGLLQALGCLLAPNGMLVVEMPDCRKFIAACDYSFIWEEHISYFTPHTLRHLMDRNGYDTMESLVYPYSLEDSMVVFAKKPTSVTTGFDPVASREEIASGRHYAQAFDPHREQYQRYFNSLRKAGKRLAVFGAGHLAAKFINVFDLKNVIDVVIDDNPHKQGLSMPGSGVAIIDSSHLAKIDLCLLALSPESEQKVIVKQQAYLDGGGRFSSIFPASSLALQLQ